MCVCVCVWCTSLTALCWHERAEERHGGPFFFLLFGTSNSKQFDWVHRINAESGSVEDCNLFRQPQLESYPLRSDPQGWGEHNVAPEGKELKLFFFHYFNAFWKHLETMFKFICFFFFLIETVLQLVKYFSKHSTSSKTGKVYLPKPPFCFFRSAMNPTVVHPDDLW